MLSRAEQAAANLEQAREMRTAGRSYREVGRRLGLTPAQLGLVRRTLKREKAGQTRLRSADPHATDRDLPVSRAALPIGLRKALIAAGYHTLGDLADRIDDPDRPGLESVPGIGPLRAALVLRVLDAFGLRAGASDLKGAVEALFPEFGDD